jgi:glycerol-3-phosphate acyltransferase PlsY
MPIGQIITMAGVGLASGGICSLKFKARKLRILRFLFEALLSGALSGIIACLTAHCYPPFMEDQNGGISIAVLVGLTAFVFSRLVSTRWEPVL